MTSINLLSLVRIGQLDNVPYSADSIKRMLRSARQRLHDADLEQNSHATRFDCAYTTIRSVADMSLHLAGYRTSTSKPGHHQTAIQCLAHTLNVDDATVRVLDCLRKQRNLSDYDGEPISDAVLRECLNQARMLLRRIEKQIRRLPEVRPKAN